MIEAPLWMWASFLGVVASLLVLDLGVLRRKDHVVGIRESLYFSIGYIAAGIFFGFWIWLYLGHDSAQLYWTGYIIEKTLSVDNIFVISLIFSYFSIPRKYQHRVLFWGILGVVILRGIMIGVGAELVSRFHWVLYIFAIFLIFTGVKMLLTLNDKPLDIGQNPIVRFCKRYLPLTAAFQGHNFVVRKGGRFYFTPLLLALVVVEFVDLIFAIDSVPAILALTTDTYIVYTSNIFAILGLRALYFAMDAVLHRFRYLKYALAIVLIFIGSKIYIADIFDLEHFPPTLSLGVVVCLLALGIFYSLWKTKDSVPQDKP